VAFLKGKIDEIFGEGTIDVSSMSHENFLLEYAIRMADSRDIDELNEKDTQMVITNELIDAYNELRSMEQNGKIPEGVNIFDYLTGEWSVPQEQQGALPDIYMYPDFTGDIPVFNL
jgi:hypothetical protein